MITCDAKRNCVVDDLGYTLAFGSPTLKDCENEARQGGWKQLSARLWLCPDCVRKAEREKSVRDER